MTSSVAKKLLSPIPEKPAELTLNDRCDRCGAEALVRIVFPDGKDLIMCNHHTNEHELALVAAGGTFYRKNTDHLVVDRAKGDSH
jgi:hypothetical protein